MDATPWTQAAFTWFLLSARISTPTTAEFGTVELVRQLDYYDGQLQLIDLAAVIQSVTVARKRPESEASGD